MRQSVTISDQYQLGRELCKDRDRCMRFLHKNFQVLTQEECEEVYSQSMLAFWEKVHRAEIQVQAGVIKILKDGKLVNLDSLLTTYMTSIYKFQAMNYIRDHHKNDTVGLEENLQGDEDWLPTQGLNDSSFLGILQDYSDERDDEGEINIQRIDFLTSSSWCNYSPEQIDIIKNLVLGLGSPCRELLWATFAEDLSSAEIALLLGYSGARTAITQRSRCIDRLKTRFNQIKDRFYEPDDEWA